MSSPRFLAFALPPPSLFHFRTFSRPLPLPAHPLDGATCDESRQMPFLSKAPSSIRIAHRSESSFPEVFGGNEYKSNQKNRICKNRGVKNEIRVIFLRHGCTLGVGGEAECDREEVLLPRFSTGRGGRARVRRAERPQNQVQETEHMQRGPRSGAWGIGTWRADTEKRGAESKIQGAGPGEPLPENRCRDFRGKVFEAVLSERRPGSEGGVSGGTKFGSRVQRTKFRRWSWGAEFRGRKSGAKEWHFKGQIAKSRFSARGVPREEFRGEVFGDSFLRGKSRESKGGELQRAENRFSASRNSADKVSELEGQNSGAKFGDSFEGEEAGVRGRKS